jgi:biotin carboxylase
MFNPIIKEVPEFESMEDVVNYLLAHEEVKDYMLSSNEGWMLTVMFNEKTEELARALGLRIALPSADLRHRLDSKIVTTQLGNEAGVKSVPNVLGEAMSYAELMRLAEENGLGDDLVVQTPYGDSGRTTFFIACEDDWKVHEEKIIKEPIKVMKRVNVTPLTVEGVATRHGALVGPILFEVVGHKELTPYKGGWSGNETSPDLASSGMQQEIVAKARALGDRLYQEGYKGTFCIDFLIDRDNGEVYLGELNPRISGASPVTNLITQKYGGAPLLLFHLLEFMDVDWEIDLEKIQSRWMDYDSWSTMVLKQTEDEVAIITAAPSSGIWAKSADDGSVNFVRRTLDWSNVASRNEAFFLKILGPGEYIYKGADLGILLLRGRVQHENGQLRNHAIKMNNEIKAHYKTTPPGPDIEVNKNEGLMYKIN